MSGVCISMSRLLLVRVLLCLSLVGVCEGIACPLSPTLLTGTTVEVSNFVSGCDVFTALIKQEGVSYYQPPLQLVANTTVTFNLTATGFLSFGLTLSQTSVSNLAGDALGLTISGASLSAGSCRAFPELGIRNNTFALNVTDFNNQVYATQPCLLTWTVPPVSDTQYYYFVANGDNTASVPRQIYIVNASTPAPFSSSSSSPSGGTASSSSSGSSSSSSTGSGSSSSSSSSSTPAPGTGSSSTSSSSSSSSTGTGTGTGTSSRSSSSSSSPRPIGTSSSSSSSSAPNGNGAPVARVAVGVAAAVICAWLIAL